MPNGRNQDIAVVGSPSTSVELTLDILQEATEERVLGALVAFNATQSGVPITSVGQVVSIKLQNRWHEDSVFRNLVKRTGEIPPITNRQDTRTATLAVGATFSLRDGRSEPDVLGMVPPTGTRVCRVDQALLDSLLSSYRSEIFYLGRAYANDVLFPMWLKHFGSGPGGAGEAYHGGVFGKTGSGKSGLAKMILLGYARHQQMGILVIDPQGEFSLELSGTRVGQQGLPMDEVLRAMGRPVQRYRIENLQLDEWDTFEELLVALEFTAQLGIPVASVNNATQAASVICDALEGRYRLDQLASEDALRSALAAVTTNANAQLVYATAGRRQQFVTFVQGILQDNARLQAVFRGSWQPLASLFVPGPGRRTLYGIIQDLLVVGQDGTTAIRPAVVIDISQQGNRKFWTEGLQKRLLAKLLGLLVDFATRTLSTRESANVLVLLDEAHRHAPSGPIDEGDPEGRRLRTLLRQAVRETRKYGVGWFFISQTLGGIDREILQQLRIEFFGFGLALGDEFHKLREFAGGDDRAMELYQSFRDPQSFPRRDLQEFPFMAVGPASPLAFSGKPLFFSAFIDPQEFLRANNLPERQGTR